MLNGSVPEILKSYTQRGSTYSRVHNEVLTKEDNALLLRFLSATVDEVRLRTADEYVKHVLIMDDMPEVEYFRTALLRREISADIEWVKHRDHAAHTLYNYLLGWYVYDHVGAVRKSIRKHLRLRLGSRVNILSDDYLDRCFASIWQYVSLLHDIGYLFEGSLLALSTEAQSEHVWKGMMAVQDFFNHRFWSATGLDSHSTRKILRELSSVDIPQFRFESMADVADALCYLDDCEAVRAAAVREMKNIRCKIPVMLASQGGISMDAFDLWISHYEHYGLRTMAERIRQVQRAFKSMVWDGLSNSGVRLLDHGVCSGLLCLQYATFCYRVYFGLGDDPPGEEIRNRIWQRVRVLNAPLHVVYEAHWWWAAILWATAATAIHNLQQSTEKWSGTESVQQPLKMDEDPIAYLGILVDIVQEWDRYSVIPNSALSGELPLQGIDTGLSNNRSKIEISYNDPERSKRVGGNLEQSLADWEKVIRLSP